MPDISMCLNDKCPNKRGCYRYKAIPYKHLQSYLTDCKNYGTKECVNFWNIKHTSIVNKDIRINKKDLL